VRLLTGGAPARLLETQSNAKDPAHGQGVPVSGIGHSGVGSGQGTGDAPAELLAATGWDSPDPQARRALQEVPAAIGVAKMSNPARPRE